MPGPSPIKNTLLTWPLAAIGLIIAMAFLPSLYHVAHSDQLSFLYEVAGFEKFRDIALYSFSYTRTRLIDPGDVICFRPLLYLGLSLETALFRYHFALWQAVGIGLHVTVAGILMSLLMCIRRHTLLAAGTTLLFATLCLSAEMVIWHHINMYMIALALILIALKSLLPDETQVITGRRMMFPVICLTIASFINEFAAIASMALCLTALIHRFKYKALWLLIPPAVYLTVSALDYAAIFPEGNLLSAAFTRARGALGAWALIPNALKFLSAIALFPFLPAGYQLLFSDRPTAVLVVPSAWGQHPLWLGVGNTFIILLIIWIAFVWIRNRPTGKTPLEPAAAFGRTACLLLIISYVGMVIAAHGQEPVESFLARSLYHFYAPALFAAIGGYCCLGNMERFSAQPLFKNTTVLILALLFFASGLNAVKLHAHNRMVASQVAPLSTAFARINALIDNHGHEVDFSFDIIVGGNADRNAMLRLLYRRHINTEQPKYVVEL